jgi:hypothetical protein
MTSCPTGWVENDGVKRTCDRDADIGSIISSVIFNDNDTQWPFMA